MMDGIVKIYVDQLEVATTVRELLGGEKKEMR
jgi:hypothetical protein